MQSELTAGLSRLICPEDEECSVHVTEHEKEGLAVSLKVQKSRLAAERWGIDHDPEAGWYTYQTVFETEPVNEIVDELRRILDMPCITTT